MRVRELMSSPVFTCQPEDSLESAARVMWEHDCGILPVVDPQGHVQATVTDRDICMGAYMRGARLSDVSVAGVMSRRALTCRPDDDLTVAARKMAEAQVRRMPVVDGAGRPRGVLSLNDIALAAERNSAVSTEALKVLIAASHHPSKRTEVRSSQAVTPS